ncbi:hypothetical protein [Picrophilus oshimae]|uniref:Carbonic anhydrase n=1 Tax=Picrophilus torridus (strain ATCC 700027 / DSM 9790 / JCM 10055 / NBRC 100828 / KAW 2/3) TaxID=1122961 RepID=Q6L2P4_PICTO|nr:hypothetical protein [Picrophilus oshimae]AAT42758.1 hypothetical protein PTO0173 [Picrophilus oshimae DSM 9789]
MDVLISCMDYRLSRYLENRADIIIRNAGGVIYDIIEKIKSLKPDRIIYMPHSDCAAMKLAGRILNNDVECDFDVYKHLAVHFKGVSDMERYNYEHGLSLLKEYFNNVHGEFIDTKAIEWPARRPYYKLLKSSDKYDDLYGYYIIQAPDQSWVEKDIKIAKMLGLSEK